MTEDALVQREATWNAKTEKWMQQSACRFRMTWMVIPADVCITSKYMVRYYMTVFAGIAALWLVTSLLCLIACTVVLAILSYHRTGAHLLYDQTFSKGTGDMISGLSKAGMRLLPILILYTLILPAITTGYMFQCAKHWNRRARRLQANPIDSNIVAANPGVWPPPPQIVD